MRNGRSLRQGAFIFGSCLVLLGFQNCAKSAGGSGPSGGGSSAGVVLGPTSQYSKVTYDPALESSVQKTSSGTVAVDVDLDSGAVVYKDSKTNSSKTCQLDVEREQRLKSLLGQGRICHPDNSAAGAVHCMAISLADIRLMTSDGSDSVLLRKEICSSGTFLCDGEDEILRNLIQDLIANPATNCR